MTNAIKVLSPATVANVSCGFDVIGLALDNPCDEIILTKNNSGNITIPAIHGADLSRVPSENVCGVALQALLDTYGDATVGFDMELTKNIYPGSGIGSSAASAAGIVVAANQLLGNPFNKTELVRFAMEGERLASGTAHADNVAPAIFGGFTLVRSQQPLDVIPLHVPHDLFVTIIHPHIEVKTSDARAILKEKILLKDAVTQWGNVAGLVAALYREDYELIGRSLTDVIIEPVRSLLIPRFAELKGQCLSAGALGGGISGSGPSVFMLSKGREAAQKVAGVMAELYGPLNVPFKTYVSAINRSGVKVIEQ